MNELGIVRYFDGGLPTNRCNLRCEYCYVSQDQTIGWDCNHDEELDFSIEEMKNALRQERLGGPCMFNFVANGETLLFNNIYELVEMIISLGHYSRIVTNGTYKKAIDKLCCLPCEYRKNLSIKFSMHYLELKKKNLLNLFFENIEKVKNSKISYSVELCASDEFIPYVEEIKELCDRRLGALPQVVELRNQEISSFPRLTKMPIDEYRNVWKQFDSPLFDFETRDYEQYQNKFCYGGEYGITFSWKTGEASQCSCPGNKKLFNLFENPDSELIFAAIGNNCPSAHCFTNYVWSVFAGNYESKDRPTYKDERDRICSNGEHWLSPTIAEIYSKRCSDFHEEYSNSKKVYINSVMKKMYTGKNCDQKEFKIIICAVRDFFAKQNSKIKKVAIYGFGAMGHWLRDVLMAAGIEVTFVIDRNAATISEDVPAFVLRDAPLDRVDAIIVSVYAEYNYLYGDISCLSDKPIFSLLQLAD